MYSSIGENYRKDIVKYARRIGQSVEFQANYVYINGASYTMVGVVSNYIMLKPSGGSSNLRVPFPDAPFEQMKSASVTINSNRRFK